MALRFSAAALELELAHTVQLELLEPAAPRREDSPSAPHDECPSDDDLLGFCHGSLLAHHSIAVQQHLDVCPTCMDIATLALHDFEPHEPVQWLDVASNFRPGERIDDRYEVLRFLASGGMGEVYEVLDLRTSQHIALKAILAAASDSREMLRSFRREARLARKVRHPNVCHVHRASAGGDAIERPLLPYFTMEFIEGETLHERLRSGPLPLQQTLDIARQMLQGIQAIHHAGLLHLDIKSNNVMLRRGPKPEAMILDFGLARRARGRERTDALRPLQGSMPYIPPEQFAGVAPSAQNDIFAFGVVLFQMLTGELPLSNVQGNPASSMAERLTADPSARKQIVSAVPQGLGEVVWRCLAERGERFRDVEGLMGAIDPTRI